MKFFYSARVETAGILKRLLGALFLACLVAACGGGSEGTVSLDVPPVVGTDDDTDGLIIIGLTDGEGDFITYSVAALSIKLTRANGTEVETMPISTTVDFAQYTELTEFVTAATVPNGLYTGASIVLDYSEATIIVEDADGDAVAATVFDETGQPVGVTELSVQFADRDGFRIVPGIPAHLTLDFDLEASHKVEFEAGSAAATLDGVLIADPFLEDAKTHRARGLLADVDVANDVFAIRMRPFNGHTGDFGGLRIHVVAETAYEVDGESYVGTPGLEALAHLATGSPVVARGALDIQARRFIAGSVLAGTSVPFGESDIATGTVVARSGDVLTLKGTTIIRDDMSIVFNDAVAVTVGPDTRVRQQASVWPTLTPADISVGQRLTVIGDLSGEIPGGLELDAANGLARILFSDIGGTVNTVNPLALALTQINRRRPVAFDFSGTGAGEDADPDHYEIDPGMLPLDRIELGDPLRVRGFVAPFGTAPADFLAQTLVNVSALPAAVFVNWPSPGSMDAFIRIDAAGIVIDLSDEQLGDIHYALQAGVAQDLLDNGTMLEIVARDAGRGVFVLNQSDTRQVFTDFEGFTNALSERLDGSAGVVRLRASGGYAADTNTLTAHRLILSLE